jgi:hypothetical protein
MRLIRSLATPQVLEELGIGPLSSVETKKWYPIRKPFLENLVAMINGEIDFRNKALAKGDEFDNLRRPISFFGRPGNDQWATQINIEPIEIRIYTKGYEATETTNKVVWGFRYVPLGLAQVRSATWLYDPVGWA